MRDVRELSFLFTEIYHVVTALQVVCALTNIYMIVRVSPSAMKTYKYYVLHLAVLTFAGELIMLLARPVLLFPYSLIYSDGYFSDTNQTFVFAVLFILINGIAYGGASYSVTYAYRLSVVLPSGRLKTVVTPTWWKAYGLRAACVIQNAIPLLQSWQSAEVYRNRVLAHDDLEFFVKSTLFNSTSYIFMFDDSAVSDNSQFIIIAGGGVVFFLFIIAVNVVILNLINKSQMSAKSKQLHRMLTIQLWMQIFLVFALSGILSVIFAFRGQMQLSRESELVSRWMFVAFCTQSISNFFLSVVTTRVYRVWLWSKLPFKKRIINDFAALSNNRVSAVTVV